MSARVFLCHNTADKPSVEALARRLRDQEGIQVWLDQSDLIPGESSQEGIEKALAQCEVCAVFLGPSGLGPWQDLEVRGAINRRVRERQSPNGTHKDGAGFGFGQGLFNRWLPGFAGN